MVTDLPYGVNYDPEWRAKAGANGNRRRWAPYRKTTARLGEAWALFLGTSPMSGADLPTTWGDQASP